MPRSSATVHCTEKLTRSRKLSGPWTTTWSKQYLSTVHRVTCSLLWVRCLFDRLLISDFGGKWPLKWKFLQNVFPDASTGHRATFRGQIWWKSAVAKFPNGPLDYHTQKNSGSAELVPAAILPKMGRSPQKFSGSCHPLTCPRVPNLVRIGCVLPDLFRKDGFFGPKSQYNNLYAFSQQRAENNVTEIDTEDRVGHESQRSCDAVSHRKFCGHSTSLTFTHSLKFTLLSRA